MRPGARLVAQTPTTDWGKRFYLVSAEGEKLATILAAPVDERTHERDAIVVQFANATLPTGEYREIGASMWAMGCTFTDVQRLDIAADGWMNDDGTIGGGGDYIGVVQAALGGWGRYYGKARWATEHLGADWNGFAFGTRAANKFLRCYRKKREMKAKGMKPHVVAAWSAALGGADPMADPREVGRLEVQLKGRELNRYYQVRGDWDRVAQLHGATLRAGVHQSTVRTMFDFRIPGRDGRARTAHEMAHWDYSLACAAPPPVIKRDSKRLPISEQRVKMALHWMHDIAYLAADAELMQVALRMATVTGFADYFNRRQSDWAASCDRAATGQRITDGITAPPELPQYLRAVMDGLRGRSTWQRAGEDALRAWASIAVIEGSDT